MMYYVQMLLGSIGINAWWLGHPHKPARRSPMWYKRLMNKRYGKFGR